MSSKYIPMTWWFRMRITRRKNTLCALTGPPIFGRQHCSLISTTFCGHRGIGNSIPPNRLSYPSITFSSLSSSDEDSDVSVAAAAAVATAASNGSVDKYRLLYFDTRGAAEPIRYLLAVHGVTYWDVRFPLRSSAKGFGVDGTFLERQREGQFRANLGRLPILQIVRQDKGEHVGPHDVSSIGTVVAEIGQTHAILRFLADRHGSFGDGPWERAHIDAFVEGIRDVKAAWYSVKKGNRIRHNEATSSSSTSSHQAKKDFLSNELPQWCHKLEESLPPLSIPSTDLAVVPPPSISPSPSPSPWLIGNRMSLADIALYSLLSTPASIMTGSSQSFFDGADPETIRLAYGGGGGRSGGAGSMAACPRMAASIHAMSKLRSVQEWEARRPDTFS